MVGLLPLYDPPRHDTAETIKYRTCPFSAAAALWSGPDPRLREARANGMGRVCREDRSAISMGIAVKMITGDQLAIARETARQLGMSTDIYNTGLPFDGKQAHAHPHTPTLTGVAQGHADLRRWRDRGRQSSWRRASCRRT